MCYVCQVAALLLICKKGLSFWRYFAVAIASNGCEQSPFRGCGLIREILFVNNTIAKGSCIHEGATAIMKDLFFVLPKNKGIPKLTWVNKCPLYTRPTTSVAFEHRASVFLLRNYRHKIPFIYKCVPSMVSTDLDSGLQLLYESLMLLHALLAFDGVLYLETDATTRGYLEVLVFEIFGEDVTIKYIAN